MDLASKTASLTWDEYIIYKIVTKTHETRHSLDQYDIEYTLKLNEAVDLEAYIERLRNENFDLLRKDQEAQEKLKKRGFS